jgi:hypothetical protein
MCLFGVVIGCRGWRVHVYVIGFSISFMRINSFNPINVLYYTCDRITVENSNATQDWFATVRLPLCLFNFAFRSLIYMNVCIAHYVLNCQQAVKPPGVFERPSYDSLLTKGIIDLQPKQWPKINRFALYQSHRNSFIRYLCVYIN